MKSYIVATTKEEAEAEDGVEVMASSHVEAAEKYESMGYDAWEDEDGRCTVWVDDDGPEGPVCVDLDEGEIIEDGEEDE
jgi:hypothetical protein